MGCFCYKNPALIVKKETREQRLSSVGEFEERLLNPSELDEIADTSTTPETSQRQKETFS